VVSAAISTSTQPAATAAGSTAGTTAPLQNANRNQPPPADGRLTSPKHVGRISAIDIIAPLATTATKGPQQLYFVRHGERIDFTFGKDWIQNSFNQAGKYIRYDLNMPKSMPKQKSGQQDFSKDSPLTVQGCFQA